MEGAQTPSFYEGHLPYIRGGPCLIRRGFIRT